MPASTDPPFNPCSLAEAELIPAKIWELLRRNTSFRADVERLRKLDDKERATYAESGKYHGFAWKKSCALVRKAGRHHPFARVALKWLVPEPLLTIIETEFGSDGRRIRKRLCPLRPSDLDAPRQSWPWRSEGSHQGWPTVRGPEVIHLTSNKRKRCDRVIFLHEWRGWKAGVPMFDCDTPWPMTPEGFRHKFMFLWRSRYDCRPDNPITKNRHDSPHAHESDFFRGWNLAGFNLARDMARVFTFDNLARDYRVFAVPRTILTKGTADAMGEWLAAELKKGSDHYGKLLKRGLFNEREMLGNETEWREFLGRAGTQDRSTHYYRRVRYLRSLSAQAYPDFTIEKLLSPPKHRARGKRYVPKVRQK